MPRNASLEKMLADTVSAAPASPPTPQNRGEAASERRPARQNTTPEPTTSFRVSQPYAQFTAFANTLRAAMLKHGLNASEVAHRIWGTTKDKRGYEVARNRDRIGHYLNGTSYPEPDNLVKLAEVLNLPVEDLQIDRPVALLAGGGASYRGRQPTDVQLTMLSDNLGKSRLQFDRVVDTDLALRIFQMIKEADQKALTVAMPPSGRSFGKPEPELRDAPAMAAIAN